MTPDVWTDTPDGPPIYAVDQRLHRPGYELVRVVPVGHGCAALLYKRTPKPPPADPWGDPPPWEQDELPAGLESLTERAQAKPLSPEAEQALSRLSPEQRQALGL